MLTVAVAGVAVPLGGRRPAKARKCGRCTRGLTIGYVTTAELVEMLLRDRTTAECFATGEHGKQCQSQYPSAHPMAHTWQWAGK